MPQDMPPEPPELVDALARHVDVPESSRTWGFLTERPEKLGEGGK
jgi:hypothetical protein